MKLRPNSRLRRKFNCHEVVWALFDRVNALFDSVFRCVSEWRKFARLYRHVKLENDFEKIVKVTSVGESFLRVASL